MRVAIRYTHGAGTRLTWEPLAYCSGARECNGEPYNIGVRHLARAGTLAAVLMIRVGAQAPAVVKGPADLGDRTGKFQAGDTAPDFKLKVMHKEEHVALSSFRNRLPVALVFGSYT